MGDSRTGFRMVVDAIAGVLLIELQGRLDGRAAAQLGDCLQQAARRRRPVVVDLTEAEHLGRAAVDALVAARGRFGVRLRLAAPRHGPAVRALREAGVAHTFAVHSSPAAALTAAAPAPTTNPLSEERSGGWER